jgi:poly(3-hydroxybutyrate) depolymerase
MKSRRHLFLFIAVLLMLGSCAAAWQKNETCGASTLTGDHTYTCEGLRVDVRIPASCPFSGCGLILQLHGDGGTGLTQDELTNLQDTGETAGFITASPTGVWAPRNDKALVQTVKQLVRSLSVDARRVHVTGFSRGGFATWRLACDHSDLFASIAVAAAGTGPRGEESCFAKGNGPSRKVPVLQMMGRKDIQVPFTTQTAIRDAVIARYGLRGPSVISSDASYTHNRWVGSDGAILDDFEHSYTLPGVGNGHCIPGSKTDPDKVRYPYSCARPNAFAWGNEVVRFFAEHPMR